MTTRQAQQVESGARGVAPRACLGIAKQVSCWTIIDPATSAALLLPQARRGAAWTHGDYIDTHSLQGRDLCLRFGSTPQPAPAIINHNRAMHGTARARARARARKTPNPPPPAHDARTDKSKIWTITERATNGLCMRRNGPGTDHGPPQTRGQVRSQPLKLWCWWW
ncbi:hypothetical protein H4582DRAFT_130584 [Lactarius indigo]|nr:hypothetical protein H4582DRAFT_130584 [Lactarius indigo]